METTELREYLIPLRRWWWLVLASTLLAAASSAYITYSQPPLYQSRTTIMVGTTISDPNPEGNQIWMAEQLLTMYADMINRQSVRQGTMEALGLSGLPGYTARIVPNTQFMDITVIDTDPVRAQAVADELVRQLILRSPAGSEQQDREAFVYEQLDELEEDIRATKFEIANKEDELGEMMSARQIADAQNQIAALQTKLAALQTNYASLLQTTQRGAVNTINVVEPANLPAAPMASKLLSNILLAAAIGFVLGAGAAYLLEYMDDSIKDTEDVQRAIGAATLSAVPELTAKDLRGGDLVMLNSAQSPPAEAYRILRTNLQFASIDEPVKTLLVTSPDASEGKSITAGNLATALAQSGRHVIILDCDMHRPRLHRVFNTVNNVGVTSALLSEGADPTTFLQRTDVENLRLMTTGPLPPNSAELLGSQRMRHLLDTLGEQADYIVLDSPPVLALSDAAVLATQVDGVLLVILSGKTRVEGLKRAQAVLEQVNASIVGVLLNRVSRRSRGHYYYYQYYSKRYRSKYYRRTDVGEMPSLPASSFGANGHESTEATTTATSEDSAQSKA